MRVYPDFSELTYETDHYGASMRPNILQIWASAAAEQTFSYCNHNGVVPMFVYCGMSGVAHATALTQEYYAKKDLHFGQVYVRKEGESNHNGLCYQIWQQSIKQIRGMDSILVFVDDLIDSGATFRRTIDGVAAMYAAMRDLYACNGFEPPLPKLRTEKAATCLNSSYPFNLLSADDLAARFRVDLNFAKEP